MKLPKLLTRKKLRAATARRSLGAPDEMDYEEMSEPNMKLSRALLIVLVLHVVAVAGIIAFNTIKSRQGPPPRVSTTSGNTNATQTATVKTNPPTVVSSEVASTRKDETAAARTPAKTVAKEEK
jgi:flagellar basal body-associated protein FliL